MSGGSIPAAIDPTDGTIRSVIELGSVGSLREWANLDLAKLDRRQRAGVIGAALVCLAVAFGLSRFMRTLLYDIEPTDPLTYGLVALALVGIAALASLLPARRAARVDPIIAMQSD